jgi:hypothetical protein
MARQEEKLLLRLQGRGRYEDLLQPGIGQSLCSEIHQEGQMKERDVRMEDHCSSCNNISAHLIPRTINGQVFCVFCAQEADKVAARARREKARAKQREKAAKRAILKEFFGDDPDFMKVIIEDYNL